MSEQLSLRPLRPGSSMPLWLQLKHALRDLITFELRPGDRIPSEAELGRHYGLSRITVRQAITTLVDEGVLHRQHGRGTFVLPARLAEPLAAADHFLQTGGFDGADQGPVTLQSTETMPAPEWLADKLGVAVGEEVHKIRKVLLPDGVPAAFRTTFVPRYLAPSLLEANLLRPLHAIFEQVYDLWPSQAEETIEFIIADEFRAGLLRVAPNHPLILVERLTYLDGGEAVECARTYYRADRFQFRHRLHREGTSRGPGTVANGLGQVDATVAVPGEV